jgi:DNA processing protein
MALSERAARMALSCVVEAGDPNLSDGVDRQGAQSIWAQLVEGRFGKPLALRAAAADIDAVVRLAEKVAVRFLTPEDTGWPKALDDLRHCQTVQQRGGAPFGLWLRGPGDIAGLVERSVAIVGSRASTSYGASVATDLAADLTSHDVTVISGGAYGIDAAAHGGALAAGGPTLCVLANGVDVAYPPGNQRLFASLAKDHLLVSELPPGAHPTRVRFLARNRLIAALSRGTVVVEAALRSGARNTATWALECSRQLMAVPGPVHSAMSAGPHLMIRSGQATLVTCAADVLELVSPMGEHLVAIPHGTDRLTDELDGVRLAVFEAVPRSRRASVGKVALAAGVSVPECLAHLGALEAAGLVDGTAVGWRALVPPARQPPLPSADTA